MTRQVMVIKHQTVTLAVSAGKAPERGTKPWVRGDQDFVGDHDVAVTGSGSGGPDLLSSLYNKGLRRNPSVGDVLGVTIP